MPVGKLWASSLRDRREGVLSQAVLQSATSTYLIWLGLLFEIMKYVNYIRRMTNVAISDVNSMLLSSCRMIKLALCRELIYSKVIQLRRGDSTMPRFADSCLIVSQLVIVMV